MDKYLTIIQYESAADQTFLVMNNEQIFSYYENPETNINVMLSILTKEQYETLLSKGYYIQVVEKNPEITNYALYENAELNQGALLAPLGKVYILTNNHTLIRKVDQTVVYDIEPSTFTEIPLKDMKADIAQNNNVDLSEKVVENTKELKIGPPPISHPSPVLDYILNPGIIFIILMLLVIVAFIAWKKFRKTPPQTINDPPLPPIS